MMDAIGRISLMFGSFILYRSYSLIDLKPAMSFLIYKCRQERRLYRIVGILSLYLFIDRDNDHTCMRHSIFDDY